MGEPHIPVVVGDVVAGKYALEAVLGEGGMGVVFAARHMLTARRVAVKVLTGTGGETAERALAEAQVLARVEHPNVVSVLDVGEHQGAVFIVMELLRGQSLADIAHRRAMPVEEAVRHLMPALSGVAAVHAAGIVHRDLKPENLFVSMDASGTGYDTKVLDFGISKITDGTVARKTLSRSGATVGTPQYMAPEQVRADASVDARADVYALGVILYELLSGRLPFIAPSVTALAVAIVNEEPARLDVLVPQLDATVAAIVHRAIAKRPENRFADVASFAAALEPYAGGVRFAPPRRLPEHTGRISMKLERVVALTPRETPRAITQDVVVRQRRKTDPRADPDSIPPPPPPAEVIMPTGLAPAPVPLEKAAAGGTQKSEGSESRPPVAAVFRPRAPAARPAPAPPSQPPAPTSIAASPARIPLSQSPQARTSPSRPPSLQRENNEGAERGDVGVRTDVTPRPVARSLEVAVVARRWRPIVMIAAPIAAAALAAGLWLAFAHGDAPTHAAVHPSPVAAPVVAPPVVVAPPQPVVVATADAGAPVAVGAPPTVRHGGRHAAPGSGTVTTTPAATAGPAVVVGRSGTLSTDDF